MNREPPTIVVLGDVIADVVVHLRAPFARGSDTRATIQTRPGGSGANQAAWLASLGLEVHLVGRIGVDALGREQAEALRAARVVPHLATDPRLPTGVVTVLVDPDGERSMLSDRGANLGLRTDDLPNDLFRPGRHLHLSGYALFEPSTRPAALTALRLAREHGMTCSVDPGSASFLEEAGAASFLAWTGGVALCFPNLDEGQVLSGERDPAAVAQTLTRSYGAVALKLGAGGAIWARAGEPIVARAAEPAPAVVDTTGAGDAFCAGFLARWLAGADPADALHAGLRHAARALTQLGGRPPHPATSPPHRAAPAT